MTRFNVAIVGLGGLVLGLVLPHTFGEGRVFSASGSAKRETSLPDIVAGQPRFALLARAPRLPRLAAGAAELPSFEVSDEALALLARDAEPDVKQEALLELGYRAAPQAQRTLQRLLTDTDDDVRVLAAETLAMLGDPRAIAPLRQALSNEGDERARTAIGHSIERLLTPHPER